MRTYLGVPFHEKEVVRKLGARWDGIAKRWYVENIENMEVFMRWMPEYLTKPHKETKR